MPSAIILRMIDKHALTQVDQTSWQDFVRDHDQAVLFFAENPQRYPESNDVAMVLPEIIKQFYPMAAAIVSATDEHALQQQFDFTRWPALAFFHHGQYAGAICGIQNWQDYLQQIRKLLTEKSASTIPATNL